MPLPVLFSLVGVRADGSSSTLAEGIPNNTQAEHLRQVAAAAPDTDDYDSFIIRSAPVSDMSEVPLVG